MLLDKNIFLKTQFDKSIKKKKTFEQNFPFTVFGIFIRCKKGLDKLLLVSDHYADLQNISEV